MTKVAPSLRALAATRKIDTRVIGPVTRHLLSKDLTEGRRQDCIHPSEASRSDWCPRRDYYRISVARGELDIPVKAQVGSSLWLEKIFDDGHESGRKWQAWVRSMGRLRGEWLCIPCGGTFMATSPTVCPDCGANRPYDIVYMEVPCSNEEFLLDGRADGDVDEDDSGIPLEEQVLFENKYLGTGSLRIEVPGRVKKYEFEHEGRHYVDWDKLWFELRRPFPSHFKQLLLYMMCAGRKAGVVIYEPKFMSGQPREFAIRFSVKYIEDILEGCSEVVYGLSRGYPPERPPWAERGNSVCKGCPFYDGCWPKQRGRGGSSPQSQRPDSAPNKTGRNRATKKAVVPVASGTNKSDRPNRRPVDDTVHEVRPVHRLPRGEAGSSGDRRARGRGGLRSLQG